MYIKMKNYLKFFLALAFILLHFGSAMEIQTLTDSTMDSTVGDGHGNWLLVFYLDSCPHCKSALTVLNDLAQNSALSSDEQNLKGLQIGKIECSANNWACMRFNVTRVPTIVALQNDQLFEYNFYATEERLLSFLKEEKLVGAGKKIPPIMGYTGILFKIFEEAVNVLNEQMQNVCDTYLGSDSVKWSSTHTIGMLLFFLFNLLVVEYIVVFYCCSRKKKTKVEIKPEETGSTLEAESSNQVKEEARPKQE